MSVYRLVSSENIIVLLRVFVKKQAKIVVHLRVIKIMYVKKMRAVIVVIVLMGKQIIKIIAVMM